MTRTSEFPEKPHSSCCIVDLTKLRKATISCVMCAGTTRLPMDGFLWNSIFKCFSKKCRESSNLINIWQKQLMLYMKTEAYWWQYLAEFFWERKVFQTKEVQNIKNTHFVFSNFISQKLCSLLDNVETYCTAELATDENRIWRMRIACWIA
jgi:hypothetical protein